MLAGARPCGARVLSVTRPIGTVPTSPQRLRAAASQCHWHSKVGRAPGPVRLLHFVIE